MSSHSYKSLLSCTTYAAQCNAALLLQDLPEDRLRMLNQLATESLPENASSPLHLGAMEMLWLIYAFEDRVLEHAIARGVTAQVVTLSMLDPWTDLRLGCSCQGCFGACLKIARQKGWLARDAFELIWSRHYREESSAADRDRPETRNNFRSIVKGASKPFKNRGNAS